MKYEGFGELVDERLYVLDRSRSWLAGRVGVTPGAVTRWCAGDTRPRTPELVIRIADVLGIYKEEERQELLVAVGYSYRTGEETMQDEKRRRDPASPAPQTQIGSVTGQVHTGQGDIHVGSFNVGASPTRESLLQALRAFRDEVSLANERALGADLAEQAIEVTDTAVRELRLQQPEYSRVHSLLSSLRDEIRDHVAGTPSTSRVTQQLDEAIRVATLLSSEH